MFKSRGKVTELGYVGYLRKTTTQAYHMYIKYKGVRTLGWNICSHYLKPFLSKNFLFLKKKQLLNFSDFELGLRLRHDNERLALKSL